MKKFKVTPHAQKALKNIGRYTFKKWGRKQRDAYLRKIDQRFYWLGENPRLGKERPDIKEGFYCYKESNHLIFYTKEKDHIAIIGIPHQKMDIIHYFQGS